MKVIVLDNSPETNTIRLAQKVILPNAYLKEKSKNAQATHDQRIYI